LSTTLGPRSVSSGKGNGPVACSIGTDEEESYQDWLAKHTVGNEVLSDMP
jgi:hypothetical protein